MDIKQDLDTLLNSGLTFSIEIKPGAVWIWVGPYLKTTTPTATVASMEQAITWLQRMPEPRGRASHDDGRGLAQDARS
jgi:hypothetical protein